MSAGRCAAGLLVLLAAGCAGRPPDPQVAPAAAPAPPAPVAPAEIDRQRPTGETPPVDRSLAPAAYAAYGFDERSGYDRLLDVLWRAQADLRAGHEPERARTARFLALSQVPRDLAVRVQYDFVLQQPETEYKAAGAFEMLALLKRGSTIEPELARLVADLLCRDLAALRTRGDFQTAFARDALQLLLLFHDSRALDIVLTDANTLGGLSRNDKWANGADAATFTALAQAYRERESEQSPRALLYDLMAERMASAGHLEPQQPVFDHREYMNFPREGLNPRLR